MLVDPVVMFFLIIVAIVVAVGGLMIFMGEW